MDKKSYLFTLTISPVQSFISQARKTKDLFAGSEILSDLMNFSIEQTKQLLDNYELILPDIETPSKANKIIIKITTSDSTKVKDFGKLLEALILNQFKSIANNTFDKNFKDLHKPKEFDGQIENLLQIFWVAVKLENDYLKSYKQLEQDLGAVKNLRTFKQLEQLSGRKCSVCGERNGLFYKYQEDKDKKLKKPSYIIRDAVYLKKSNQIDDNETLCAVCFTKRFSSKNPTFESTEEIANEKKYYALIQFDIDDMGKKLSELNLEGQKELSKELGEFAQKAKKIVDESGKTIYAGGDDFLGFVKLEKLFNVIDEVKKVFNIVDMTFSTSIIISHWKTPLHKVLDFSRSLLEESKNHFDDKNGMGLIVLSDSAVNAKSFCKYEDFKCLKEFKDNKVAMSLHYKLHTVFSYLDKLSYDEFLMQKKMIKVEIKRLLKREDGEFKEGLYDKLVVFFDKQKIELSTNSYQIDFDNFIGYLKTLEQLRKVM